MRYEGRIDLSMTKKTHRGQPRIFRDPKAGPISRALPLFPLQPVLRRIVLHVAKIHPELFERLETGAFKTFLIDAKGIPFLLVLKPDPNNPTLVARSRHDEIQYDVLVSGKFSTLLQMIDSKSDSDALFFNRNILISGDTEAILLLRNALDDMDTTLADDVATAFGPLAKPMRASINMANRITGARA